MKINKVIPNQDLFKPLGTTFDWMEESQKRNNMEIYTLEDNGIKGALAIYDDFERQTLSMELVQSIEKGYGVYLISYACKLALERGWDDLTFTPKSALEQYYEELGAQRLFKKIYVFQGESLIRMAEKWRKYHD